MTFITIKGKKLQLAYNMLAGITYERTTGNNPFDFSKIDITKLASIAELGYCMLLASNPEEDVPSMQDVFRSFDTVEKMTSFAQAVSTEIVAFFAPSKADQPNEEDASKNA